MTDEAGSEATRSLEVWKVAIQTQMHFNDLIIKFRGLLGSIVLAFFGVIVVWVPRITAGTPEVDGCTPPQGVRILGFPLPAAAILCGMMIIVGHMVLDMCYYLPLLLGAVSFTEKMDADGALGAQSGLTSAISSTVSHRQAYFFVSVYYMMILLPGAIGVYALCR